MLLTGRLLRVLTPGLALAVLPLTAAVLLMFIAARPSPALVAAAEVIRKVPNPKPIRKVLETQPPCSFYTPLWRCALLLAHIATLQPFSSFPSSFLLAEVLYKRTSCF